ncbi:hypothetical protein ASG31_06665 [Chryseobacterium sp. Leaf404]|uniref:transglutaminase-like domain-containing protein n=1 Tax=unclassified Chryseobacterium TaxID=2593645 RepID=UPI0006F559CD|nr:MULTISPECIES: transglutaminase-like domain-containing protein [unclassified Chryseobacterium]KQT18400.1 hypothetical protein ASG31_06665 [Chryseobacterium sp. Leaf404]
MIKQIALGIILYSGLCFSQHKFLNYPTITQDELIKPKSLIDASAPAEILYNSVRYDIENLSAEKTCFSKIKIYDRQRSEKWLNIEIPVVQGEQLSSFVVNVYKYSNGKIEKVTFNKKEQLKENVIKGLKFFKMAIPNVADGDVIEYSYKLSTGIMNVACYLEHDIPAVYQEYNLEYPDGVTYVFNSAGSLLQPEHHVSEMSSRLGVGYTVERFAFTDTKAIKEEKFVKNANRYRKRIKPELQKYTYRDSTYEFAKTWNKIAKGLDESDNFGGFLRTSTKDVLPEDIKKTARPTDRADKIFDYVKSNVKWNKNHGFIADQNLKSVLKTKSGNSAEINLLLVNLFRNAGLDANPFLISTVENGILNIVAPNMNNLNYLLASVKIDGQYYFYDATSPNSKANLLPERDWNDFGILIEGQKATDISFSNTNVSTKNLYIKAKLDVDSSKITGVLSSTDGGMYAIEAFDSFDENQTRYNDSFKTQYKITTKNVETKRLDSGEMSSQIAFEESQNIDVVGSKIIFNPLLFLMGGNEEFDQKEERQNHIDLVSPISRKKTVDIEIPEGYTLSIVPKSKNIVTSDKELTFKYKCELVDSNILRVTSEIKIASDNYPKEYYPAFRQIWKTVSDTENQVVSLTKK